MRHPQDWYFPQFRCNTRKISAKRYQRAKLDIRVFVFYAYDMTWCVCVPTKTCYCISWLDTNMCNACVECSLYQHRHVATRPTLFQKSNTCCRDNDMVFFNYESIIVACQSPTCLFVCFASVCVNIEN